MLTISPYLTTRVAHLPWTAAFDPKAALLLGNWYPTFLVQTSTHLIIYHEFLEIFIANNVMSFNINNGIYLHNFASPFMTNLKAIQAKTTSTNKTLQILFFIRYISVMNMYVITLFDILHINPSLFDIFC